ncbi:vanadium-dependent haloperoxidase [Siphonobacter sp.]|uniref:vanadium-dependent haloperoxidase n=1 Tax=Siphonobacter sp. TaxID=1869184 RepID=UPI003B3AFA81
MKRLPLLLLLPMLIFSSCQKNKQEYTRLTNNPEFLRKAERKLTQVIIHDVFGPPVAARIYAYSSLAAYEALLPAYPQYRSMAGQLNEYTATPKPEADQEYCFPLASSRAFLLVGRQWTFSGGMIDDFEKDFYESFEKALPSDVYDRSMQYGEAVAKHVIAYSLKDQYKETRGFRYTVTNQKGSWVPTPPAYMDALEPFWAKIRPLALDSATQFRLKGFPAYSDNPASDCYKEAKEVYEAVKFSTEEEKEIANFWDCNPFKMNIQGHAAFATKKMSPGGHWMSIVGLTTRKTQKDFMQTAEAYLLTSIALFDGFIACWDEKYRTVRIRPETYINNLIDDQWQPLLQTPPFPEYPSGHSVVSAASAVTLTAVLGDHLTFADSSELAYGLPVRQYSSFKAAATEAAISRLYGGIHFKTAIDDGFSQGESVGTWILHKIKTKQ